MDMGIASDIGNRNFVGAQNPDSLLSVEFYWHEPEDPNKSMDLGKLVKLPKMPYVRIQNPGDKTSIIETPVTDVHKKRWPDHWLRWQVQEGMINNGSDVPGWKLEEWTHLNPEQVRELVIHLWRIVTRRSTRWSYWSRHQFSRSCAAGNEGA